jgi:beta-lactam-binding protein with PASTA domain
VIAIAIVFVFGLATTVYLSLRSPEVTVPDVVGKDRLAAERVLGDAGLNFRVRATRPSSQVEVNTVLFQVPHAGEVVKTGQTVAMDISRSAKEGESSEVVAPEKSPEEKQENQNANENTANENKPRRNRNTNKNANDNTNANTGNRNVNAIHQATNKNANAGNTNAATNRNSNRPAVIINNNANRGVNQNGSGRPPAARPAPSAKP